MACEEGESFGIPNGDIVGVEGDKVDEPVVCLSAVMKERNRCNDPFSSGVEDGDGNTCESNNIASYQDSNFHVDSEASEMEEEPRIPIVMEVKTLPDDPSTVDEPEAVGTLSDLDSVTNIAGGSDVYSSEDDSLNGHPKPDIDEQYPKRSKLNLNGEFDDDCDVIIPDEITCDVTDGEVDIETNAKFHDYEDDLSSCEYEDPESI